MIWMKHVRALFSNVYSILQEHNLIFSHFKT
jgi:hypothetical protein